MLPSTPHTAARRQQILHQVAARRLRQWLPGCSASRRQDGLQARERATGDRLRYRCSGREARRTRSLQVRYGPLLLRQALLLLLLLLSPLRVNRCCWCPSGSEAGKTEMSKVLAFTPSRDSG
jgi:hypothetical protein